MNIHSPLRCTCAERAEYLLEIDRYGFFEADTDISANTNIFKIFESSLFSSTKEIHRNQFTILLDTQVSDA